MHNPQKPSELFNPAADLAPLFAAWDLIPTQQQFLLHRALTSRTVTPDEATICLAAAWLHTLFTHNQIHTLFDPSALAAALDEKSALLHRLAHAHVPPLAAELERPDSPLHIIDTAARFLPPHPHHPNPLLDALRQALAQLDLPPSPPPGADPTWHDNRRRLKNLILHDNPHRFLTWPVIINSMFMNDSNVAAPELAAFQSQPDYESRWLPALREDSLGAPARTPLHKDSSNNLLHHAYNLLQLDAQTPLHNLPTILEFGGGYGSTARLAFRLGFKGTYIIFDLPEFSALQRFYLGTLNFPVASAAKNTPAIHCISSMADLQTLLPQNNPALFLATWSLSETPEPFREQFLPCLLGASNLLIAYQNSFGTADNLAYFSNLAQQLKAKGRTIRDYPIAHLSNNRYLVATS